METNNKLNRLKKMMEKKKLDALFITSIETTIYLTGLHFDHWRWSGAALFIPLNGDDFFVIGPAHDQGRIKSLFNVGGKNYLAWHPPLGENKEVTVVQKLQEVLKINGINKGTLGYDREFVNAILDQNIRETFSDTNIELRDVSTNIDELMMIKDHDEIQIMKKVAAISDVGIQCAIESIAIGKTESQIAGEVAKSMCYAGAEYLWAKVNIGSGYRNFMDSWSTHKAIQRNDVVKVGCHPALFHYRADTLRTLCIGKPSEKIKKLADIIVKAGYEMLDAMKPGVSAASIDQIFRKKMKQNNFEKFGMWRTGHGIGTRHLPPYMHSGDETILQPNMVVVVQPFAYYPEGGGYGLEHMVLITKDGIEHLNKMPIELKLIEL